MAGSVVEAKLSLLVDEFNKNSRAAADEFRKLAASLRGGADEGGRASEDLGGNVTSLFGKMKEFRGEQVQQARMARFYANELMSIVPAGDAVKSKLQELLGMSIEGLAGGLSFGLAFEAAKFAIGTVVELVGEAAKKEEEARKAAEDHAAAVQKVVDGWRDYLRESQSEGQTGAAKKFGKDWEEAKKKLDEATNALVDLEAKAAEFGKQSQSAWGFKSFFQNLGFGKSGLNEEIEKAKANLAAAQVGMGAVDTGYQSASQVDQEKQNEELHRQLLQIESRYVSDEVRVRNEAEAQKLELKKKYGTEGAELQKVFAAVEIDAKNKIDELIRRNATDEREALEAAQEQVRALAREEREADEAHSEQIRNLAREEREAFEAAQEQVRELAREEREAAEAYDDQVRELARDEREANQAAADQKAKDIQNAFRPLDRAIKSAMTGLITGTESLAQVWDSLWKGMVSSAVDSLIDLAEKAVINAIVGSAASKTAAISETQGNIAVATAGAAASMAAIPLVGPEMAAAAASEMMASLEAMTGPLLAASGGFDVPAGMNPVTQLHQQEMVLPASIANPLRAAIAGGGVGGGSTTIHINAIDAGSFRDFLRGRGASALLGALNDLSRRGVRG